MAELQRSDLKEQTVDLIIFLIITFIAFVGGGALVMILPRFISIILFAVLAVLIWALRSRDLKSRWLRNKTTLASLTVIFIVCGVAALFDTGSNNSPSGQHIDRGKATQLCEAYVRTQAQNPQTVKFSRFYRAAWMEHPNGRTRLNTSFKAANLMNVELTFNVSCLFDQSGLIEGTITEKVN